MNSNVAGFVAGVVVLYNPEVELIENINSYLRQIDTLFIVDNTPRKPADFLTKFLQENLNIEYIFNNGNLGVAAALNIGAKKAIEKGYKYLLTMDQDSKASPDMIKKMIQIVDKVENLGIISPFYVNKFETTEISEEAFNYEFVVMTSGNILDLTIYQQLGIFKEEYFIDYVDTEYCMRLAKNNYKIVRINDAFLYHNEANITKEYFINKIIYPLNHPPIRLYFKTRNRLYLKKEYGKLFPEYFRCESSLYRNMIVKIIFYERKKLAKISYALRGYYDYLRKIKYSPFDI